MTNLLKSIASNTRGDMSTHNSGMSYVVPLFSQQWRVVNDDVMGGVSNGNVILANGHVVFNGVISQENNGGFSSAVLPVALPLSAQSKIKLSFIGDGFSYQLRLGTSANKQEISYKYTFDTSSKHVQTITVNFSEFVANFRGRDITSAPRLQASDIHQMSILLRHDEPVDFSFSLIHAEFM